MKWGGLFFSIAVAIASPAQTFTTIAAFDQTNGFFPNGALIQGLNGNLYGTTQSGGAKCSAFGISGCGTVFRVTPGGTITTLHSFCLDKGCPDGLFPESGLLMATDGTFYGSTYEGAGACGCGTLFAITAAGNLTTLIRFNLLDGRNPAAPLTQSLNGNLYGTTVSGGSSDQGTFFQLTQSGALTTLYSFCSQPNCADGTSPRELVPTANGFYGTTSFGGAHAGNCPTYGFCGTIFRVTPSAKLTTLYSFCAQSNCSDGLGPNGLVLANDGNFYGSTYDGGISASGCDTGQPSPPTCGTVFKMTPTGALTTLYTFCMQASCTDGANPNGSLLQATDGNFYGVTTLGGNVNSLCSPGCGTIFKITPKGTLTTLYSFCAQANCADGYAANGSLLQATDGNLYGTTQRSGCFIKGGCGTIFKLSLGLPPFIKTLLTSGSVGSKVLILGTDLRNATSVLFHGTAATFKVVSPTEIQTTVPAGATTGRVVVATPTGTLVSNVPFRVIP